jgi:hypothetical protein
VSTGISVITRIPGLELDWYATCRMQKSSSIGTDSEVQHWGLQEHPLTSESTSPFGGDAQKCFGDNLMNNLMIMFLGSFGLGFGLHVSFHVFL